MSWHGTAKHSTSSHSDKQWRSFFVLSLLSSLRLLMSFSDEEKRTEGARWENRKNECSNFAAATKGCMRVCVVVFSSADTPLVSRASRLHTGGKRQQTEQGVKNFS
ncbi:uncharacterized protein K452DRAFT_282920 [Aplosporella prunicola CBS 121167]|uniref:Secreted protein n=1 Tax=Aplosporella prunicola CBS 121167 TaxID=1176127 RepID=A0A6A6BRT1_9PEZI|nr:uncharacterized protein K452DRAFT_282920 [Aplosporella prunicola CBS 121167]KAF2146730.1 hypothetical protein K452DRAFT_282920 [Aplosporella prunicola CBS 121167]